jgi:predicted ribosomally synthesized peptide with SipW-like signal peptide
MTRQVSRFTGTRRNKVMAILAGGLVLGLGTTATLASWTDTEWVFGGSTDGDGNIVPGVGTSSFEVEQNVTTSPYLPNSFLNEEANPGQSLTFTLGALSLAPGDVVYAPVALRTADESLGGELQLKHAVEAAGPRVANTDTSSLLWGALDLRVAVSGSPAACDANAFTLATTIAIGDMGTAQASPNEVQELARSSGSTQYYCFEITLPDADLLALNDGITDTSTLQGRSVAPAWEFDAVSIPDSTL